MPKEKKDWVSKRNEKIGIMRTVAIYGCILGAGLLFGGLATQTIYDVLQSDEYLTDDGLPYRDMNNATYTYPSSELDRLGEGATWQIYGGAMLLGSTIAIVGAMIYALPPKKDEHQLRCKGTGEWKYCPECGLKLSKLLDKET